MHYALLTSAGTNKHNKVIISNALWKRIETLYRNMVCALHKQDIAKPSARKLFQQLFCCTREVSGHYAQWLPIKLIGNGWSANATKSCLLSWQSAGIEIGAGKRGNRWKSFLDLPPSWPYNRGNEFVRCGANKHEKTVSLSLYAIRIEARMGETWYICSDATRLQNELNLLTPASFPAFFFTDVMKRNGY